MDNNKYIKAMIVLFNILGVIAICYAVYGLIIMNPFLVIVCSGFAYILFKAGYNLIKSL